MKVRPSFIARLAVFLTALVVVATAQYPDPASQSALTQMRAAPPEFALSPVRLLLAGVLLVGILLEVAHRRAVWH